MRPFIYEYQKYVISKRSNFLGTSSNLSNLDKYINMHRLLLFIYLVFPFLLNFLAIFEKIGSYHSLYTKVVSLLKAITINSLKRILT